MKLLVPVQAGVESVVKRQLYKLGYTDSAGLDGRVHIRKDCNWLDVARLNVFLASGERVLISLGSQKVETFDQLYDFAYSVRWEEYLTADADIRIDGRASKSRLMAIKASGGVVKKAIVRRLAEKYRIYGGKLKENGARYVVGVSLVNDVATLTLDTSGAGLHKRGYRTLAYSAPLKETTAAAMLDWSVFSGEKPFADLFCGSGTLPIEAARYALGIAPGLGRDFAFTSWKCAPKGILDRAKEEARDGERRQVKVNIFASDISADALSIARYHAKRAGVEKHVSFALQDMRKFRSDLSYGVVVSNPPYGERLGEKEEVHTLYRDLGAVYRALPDWSMYILTADLQFERYFGKQARRKRPLWNANLACNYYCYTGAKPPVGTEEKQDEK